MSKDYSYPRLSDEEYKTLLGHAMSNIRLMGYALKLHLQGHEEELKLYFQGIQEQLEQFGMAVRGKPQPPQLPHIWQERLRYYADD